MEKTVTTATTSSTRAISLSVTNRIAWLVFDLPGEKVNKLSAAVMEELSGVLDELAAQRDLDGAVVASRKDGVFIAGADVHEIEGVRSAEEARRACRLGQALFGRIEALPFPVVAAIGGICLGGGTELALNCHGRIGSDHPRFQIGLPEVNLGILPAWSGTTKLPRLVGLTAGLDLILTGHALDARKAYKLGLLDEAVPHSILEERALEVVRRLKARGDFRAKRRRERGFMNALLEGNPLGRAIVFRQARKTVLAKTDGHYPAPLKVLDVLSRGFALSVERSLELEAEAAAELVVSPVSKNLIHLFFLSEKAKKETGLAVAQASAEPRRSASEGGTSGRTFSAVSAKDVGRLGLLGAGTMGGGIAWLSSSREIPVRLKDVSPKALGVGLAAARRLYAERAKRGRIGRWELERKMSFVSPTVDYSGFERVDLVIEAIVEDLEIKKGVFLDLEPRVKKSAIIASNTSTLPITELQTAFQNPERMAGFHFFNPVDRMPLIEIIRGKSTDDVTVATLVAFAKRLGKTPVVVADGPGFLVNRILGPYLNEACYLLLETGDLEGIDRALKRFGLPMGPLRLLDEVGIDVAEKGGRVLAAAYGDRAKPAGLIEKLAAAKRFGKKTGLGLYRHEGKRATPDPDALTLLGISKTREVGSAEAVERSVHPMVSEAARCIAEGVVASAGDLDLAMIMGTGFPPFRGGLLRYADEVGPGRVVESLSRWADRLGSRFAPSEALVEKARSGRGFYG